MSYKTDNPRQIEAQIAEDDVSDTLRNAVEVLCLICQRAKYTRVYLAAPKQKIVSVTIDEPDTFKRMMEANQVSNKYRATGAKVETNFG
jgi:hypothetical protein